MTGAGKTCVVLTLFALVSGCAAVADRPPPQALPFLTFSSHDAYRYQMLAKEHEAGLSACNKGPACDRTHYMLGLIALSESRQSATAHFKAVATGHPHSPLAASSELWLNVLAARLDEDGRSGHLVQQMIIMLVKDYLDREIALQHALKEQRSTAQLLQQELSAREERIKERDERIKELSTQLEALKQIDDDIRTKTPAIAPRLRAPQSP